MHTYLYIDSLDGFGLVTMGMYGYLSGKELLLWGVTTYLGAHGRDHDGQWSEPIELE